MSEDAKQGLYIEFKYEKIRQIDLGDNRQYPVPMQNKMQTNGLGFEVLLPVFDMEKIHKVELQDEIPQLPDKEPGMSDRYHEELCDEAYRTAREARKVNDVIRNRIKIYTRSGTIKVVHDPFERKTTPDINRETLKPSELAALETSEASGDDDKSDIPPKRSKK